MRWRGILMVIGGAAAIGVAFLPAVFARPEAALLVGGGVCLLGVGVVLARSRPIRLE